MALEQTAKIPTSHYGDGRRTHLATTSDPRALLTRQKLIDALDKLIETQDPNASVTKVCKNAGVGRSTFYTHFRTVDDLLLAQFEDAFAEGAIWDREHRLAGQEAPNDITRYGLAITVQRVQALHPVLKYANLIGSRAALEHRLAATVAANMLPIITEITDVSEFQAQLRADFLAAGLVRVILAAMERPENTGNTEDTLQIVSDVVDLFPDWVTR